MSKKNYYLEQKFGEKIVRRVPTSLATVDQDREKMEYLAPKDHKIFFVVSSTKEKVIN
ncbi:hypothetical protein [Salinimicrobium sediminis]|uniref:hypothetical protein n=1 Tax=Salinimicrobium sediminis TaxID=1343891 RepID=UPI0015C98CC5|nr:hypothetical protein [Salinimicrobium sediminis]